MFSESTSLSVAASSDWHISDHNHRFFSQEEYKDLIQEMEEQADAIIYAGDFIDGTRCNNVEETVHTAKVSAKVFSSRRFGTPVYAVLGNHDHAFGLSEAIRKILMEEGGITFVDSQQSVINGSNISVLGVKGHGGGFRRGPVVSSNVDVDKNESSMLGSLLEDLPKGGKALVVLHYSPVPETLQGEPVELYPKLGNSQLEKVIDNHSSQVIQVVHGHSHRGTFHESRTVRGVSVSNIAIQVLTNRGNKGRYKILKI